MNDWIDIHAYADGELAKDQCCEIENRLKTCTKTQAEFQAIQQIKQTLQAKCCCTDSTEVWKSCCKRLDEIDRTKKVENLVGRYAWGLVGSFAIVIAAAGAMNRVNGPDFRSTDIPRMTAGLAPIEAPLSQATEEKKRWLSNVFPSDLRFQPEVVTVTGGRTGRTVNGKRATLVDMADSKGPLTLVVIEETRRVAGLEPMSAQFHKTRINDQNAIAWQDGDSICFLVADRDCEELCGIAEQIAQR